jgi:hypothetical protein
MAGTRLTEAFTAAATGRVEATSTAAGTAAATAAGAMERMAAVGMAETIAATSH